MKHVLFLMMALTVKSAPAVMGEEIKTDAPPYQTKGTAMVPMRAIFEWLGAEVSFDSATRAITATRGEQVVSLKPGDRTATVNGEKKTLATALETKGGRTFVPVRFVAEAFGADVAWEASSATLSIEDGGRTGTLLIDRRELRSGASTSAQRIIAGRGHNKTGKLVGVLVRVVRDNKTGELVPRKTLNSRHEGEVVVELNDETTVGAVCSAALYWKLQPGDKIEIKPGKKDGEWRVVRILN